MTSPKGSLRECGPKGIMASTEDVVILAAASQTLRPSRNKASIVEDDVKETLTFFRGSKPQHSMTERLSVIGA